MKEITTYYLEMKSPAALREKADAKGLEVRECRIKQFRFNRFLYQLVGEPWGWKDRLSWADEEWKGLVESDSVRTWVGYCQGTPAGYFELQQQEEGNVEILYFGLAPGFIGRGFGGYLLSQAIKSAWAWEETQRIWVHTCTLDHPSALGNYQARGMEVFREEATTR